MKEIPGRRVDLFVKENPQRVKERTPVILFPVAVALELRNSPTPFTEPPSPGTAREFERWGSI